MLLLLLLLLTRTSLRVRSVPRPGLLQELLMLLLWLVLLILMVPLLKEVAICTPTWAGLLLLLAAAGPRRWASPRRDARRDER